MGLFVVLNADIKLSLITNINPPVLKTGGFLFRRTIKMRKVCGVGINDCKGWSTHNTVEQRHSLRYRIYSLWHSMLERCYSKKNLERKPTYRNCSVCERWLKLSNFAEDIKSLKGYEMWLNNPLQQITFDKDILIYGNREYKPNACCFVTAQESQKDVCKRCYKQIYNPKTQAKRLVSIIKGIVCVFPDGTEEAFNSTMDAERKYGFNHSIIAQVCLGRRKSHHGCSFRYA